MDPKELVPVMEIIETHGRHLVPPDTLDTASTHRFLLNLIALLPEGWDLNTTYTFTSRYADGTRRVTLLREDVDSNRRTVFWRSQQYPGDDGERLAYRELLMNLERWMQQSLDDDVSEDEMADGWWRRPRRGDRDDDGEDGGTPSPYARPRGKITSSRGKTDVKGKTKAVAAAAATKNRNTRRKTKKDQASSMNAGMTAR